LVLEVLVEPVQVDVEDPEIMAVLEEILLLVLIFMDTVELAEVT
jgi:hypothetical protein